MKIGRKLLRILTCIVCMIMICGNSSFSSSVHAEGEMTWAQLQELVNAGGNIILTNDVVATPANGILTVPEGVEVTIDLAGHNIDRALPDMYETNNGAVILVRGTLTINGEGKIKGGKNGSITSAGGGIHVYGTFTMNGGTVCENEAAGGGYSGGVTVFGNFIMNGGEISNNGAYSGGGVIVNTNGVFTMNGGTIKENTGSVYGGGVLIADGIFNMNGGTITSNHAGLGACGVHIYDDSDGSAAQFNVSGTVDITGNSYSSNTQNVYVPRNKRINVIGTLNDDSKIGVSVQDRPSASNVIVITEGLEGKGSLAAFISDNTSYLLDLNSKGEAVIGTQMVTLTFLPGEGSGEMPAKEILNGNTYLMPECTFTPPGDRDFVGWQNGDDTYDAKEEIKVNGNMTFTALWADHDWEDPVYEWSNDNKTVTATRTCKNGHSETETAETTSTVKIEATCTEKGTTEYKAVFRNEAFATQTKEVQDIEATGHDWSDWTIVIEPTPSEDGLKMRICNNQCGNVEREVIPAVFTYNFTEGAGSSWTKGSDSPLVFKVVRSKDNETTYGHYDHIEIDGTEPDPDAYTAEDGSLNITLKVEYLEQLAKGTHTLKAFFNDGEAQTSFKVKDKSSEKPDDDSPTDNVVPATDQLYSVPNTYAVLNSATSRFIPLLTLTVLMALAMAGKHRR